MNLISVLLGLSVAIVLNGLAGALLGLAIASDARTRPQSEWDSHFDAEMHSPGLHLQLAALSLVIALLSGAVTAWHAGAAPYLNAAIVGAVGLVVGLTLPSPGFPPAAQKALALVYLPVTLAGAWAFGYFAV